MAPPLVICSRDIIAASYSETHPAYVSNLTTYLPIAPPRLHCLPSPLRPRFLLGSSRNPSSLYFLLCNFSGSGTRARSNRPTGALLHRPPLFSFLPRFDYPLLSTPRRNIPLWLLRKSPDYPRQLRSYRSLIEEIGVRLYVYTEDTAEFEKIKTKVFRRL